jgi:selenocysteine lyase/cysteine desulfurase
MDWRGFRGRFPLPEGEAFLNTGTLGCPAHSTLEALGRSALGLASTLAHWDYGDGDSGWITGYAPERGLRGRLGGLFGADPLEISLTQNATMGINFIAHGLDWRPGDEVIQLDQEHPGARCPFEVAAERHGVVVRRVGLPAPADGPAEIVGRVAAAFTGRTRLLAVPHVTSGLGTVMPVKELCRFARERGAASLVDGAQAPGHVMLDIGGIGADAYSASLHKWLFAPAGCGFLHVGGGFAQKIWPTQASEAWRDPDAGFRLQQRGTGNPSLLRALGAALDLFEEVGPAVWCGRVKELGDLLRRGLASEPRLKAGLRFNSPLHPDLCAGITSVEVDGVPCPDVARRLWDGHRVRVRDVGGPCGVRISTAAYTQEEEIGRLIEGLAGML